AAYVLGCTPFNCATNFCSTNVCSTICCCTANFVRTAAGTTATRRGRSWMRVPSVYSRADVGINMTPLIDIVFQLLIFFLVSSHLARQETQLPLPLPTSQLGIEEEAAEGVSRITVNLLMDGTVRLAGHKLMVS
ncbi:MAG: ExbD/TolR family protein, partial [Planctomycetota bacterium]